MKYLFIILCLICSVVNAQYYGSSNQVYYYATGQESLKRADGPRYYGPHPGCKMCLGNHLIGSHGYSYTYLNKLGWKNWSTLHDNSHNNNEKHKPIIKKSDTPIFAPTPQFIVEKMLELAKPKRNNIIVDLGSGDGRFPITVARLYGLPAYGIEIKSDLVRLAQANARKNKVGHLAKFYKHDIFRTKLSNVDIVTLYLEEKLNAKLVPKLMTMKPGSILLSYAHKIPGLKTQKVYVISNSNVNYNFNPAMYNMSPQNIIRHVIYMWKSPFERE